MSTTVNSFFVSLANVIYLTSLEGVAAGDSISFKLCVISLIFPWQLILILLPSVSKNHVRFSRCHIPFDFASLSVSFRPLLSRHSPSRVLPSESLTYIPVLSFLTGKSVIRPEGVNSGFIPVDSAAATQPEWTIQIDNG